MKMVRPDGMTQKTLEFDQGNLRVYSGEERSAHITLNHADAYVLAKELFRYARPMKNGTDQFRKIPTDLLATNFIQSMIMCKGNATQAREVAAAMIRDIRGEPHPPEIQASLDASSSNPPPAPPTHHVLEAVNLTSLPPGLKI